MVQSLRSMTKKFDLKLSSKPENISQIEPYLQKIKTNFRINDELFYNILLVLTEAVNNSILHGNQSDPRKEVVVKLQQQSTTMIKFVIIDEGDGFNPSNLPDPTSPTQIDQPNGRGVFIMQQLSDHIQFSDSGRKVEIGFKMNA